MLTVLLFLLAYLFIELIFVHQMRYTYHAKDYSASSWMDAFVTVLALEGITSILTLMFRALMIVVPVIPASLINILGIEAYGIVTGISFVLFSLGMEAWICKIRYDKLPWVRIIVYLFSAKLTILALQFILSRFSA